MEVIQAKEKDIHSILAIIDEARKIMRETGNQTQWNNGYPSKDIILNDIHQNSGFLCIENNEILGYFCFVYGENPESTYQIIENGEWLNANHYGVIHRLASGRKAKGIARCAFEFAFSKIDNIRVDTHADNIPMRNYFLKNGFTYCGTIYVNDGTPRDAYQKMI